MSTPPSKHSDIRANETPTSETATGNESVSSPSAGDMETHMQDARVLNAKDFSSRRMETETELRQPRRDSLLTERVSRLLDEYDIKVTRQRVVVASVLLDRHCHLSADDVFSRVEAIGSSVSRATVYNTLSLMVRRGMLNQVFVEPNRIFYDSNTAPHHHVYDTSTGQLTDLDLDDVEVKCLPVLPADKRVVGIDVVVRVTSADGE